MQDGGWANIGQHSWAKIRWQCQNGLTNLETDAENKSEIARRLDTHFDPGVRIGPPRDIRVLPLNRIIA